MIGDASIRFSLVIVPSWRLSMMKKRALFQPISQSLYLLLNTLLYYFPTLVGLLCSGYHTKKKATALCSRHMIRDVSPPRWNLERSYQNINKDFTSLLARWLSQPPNKTRNFINKPVKPTRGETMYLNQSIRWVFKKSYKHWILQNGLHSIEI